MQFNESISVLSSCFGVASLSGLAVLLRSKKPLTIRNILSAVLYNGLAGLIIGLLWYNYFYDAKNLFFLVAISGLAGMGTVSLLDVASQIVIGGMRIVVTEKDKAEKTKDE